MRDQQATVGRERERPDAVTDAVYTLARMCGFAPADVAEMQIVPHTITIYAYQRDADGRTVAGVGTGVAVSRHTVHFTMDIAKARGR